jgi:Carboxypeptidase regulatory-like domain
MPSFYPARVIVLSAICLSVSLAAAGASPQSVGNSTTLEGTVVDATGAVVVGASVKIHNPVSGLEMTATTTTTGGFTFNNVAFNPYHLTVVWLQLAIRQRAGGGCDSVLWARVWQWLPGFNDVSGEPVVTMFGNGAPFTADEEYEAGFFCNGVHASPTLALPSVCPVAQFGSTLIKVPGPSAENDDHNPPRIAQRNLFDASLGMDDIFRGDKRKWDYRVTLVNLMNKVAFYNFLSTFSGTHYVTPRTITAEATFHF